MHPRIPFLRVLASACTLLGVAATCGCWWQPTVVRVMDGRPLVGRYIPPEAYARFLDGVLAEKAGDLTAAEQAYADAIAADSEAVAPRVRLGAVRCARDPSLRIAAEETFEEALRRSPTYAPAYVEMSRCAALRGDRVRAEHLARTALAFDPSDLDATRVLADVLSRSGRVDDATRLLDSLVAWVPESPEAWAMLREHAQASGDTTRACLAGRALDAREASRETEWRGCGSLRSRLDDALGAGDLERARAEVLRAREAGSLVAVRAAALGLWDVAQQEASAIAQADPSNADAIAVLLALPVPAPDARPAATAPELTDLSLLAALVLADAIDRRMGHAAARAFWAATGHRVRATADDPVLRRLQHRRALAEVD